MSSQPPESSPAASASGGVTVRTPSDPVVAIVEAAGLVADPGVHACAALAAAAHRQRYE